MSCKVLPPGGPQETERLAWRRAREETSGEAAGAPGAVAGRIEELQREGERRVAEAHAAGLREGEALGRQHAAGEIEPVAQRLARSIEGLASMRARLRREAEADLVRLAVAIARRVLRREAAVDPEALHGLVLAALEKLQANEICRVRTHPSHAALLASCLRRAAGTAIEVVPDPAREPGDVVFETERGNLDASVETQLREIERGLADVLRRRE
ncbi:MAG: FliH/SctL family protein [Bryobacteraceae bacterium]|jgi:flagellar assembly protein FliH